ncbi:MAG: hypothetical protein MZV65_41560 [Chromatiales bacterium]|nr:hypothetical protein [Chromatiales bacterium]
MMLKTLLDTDILSLLLRQQPAVINRAIQYLSILSAIYLFTDHRDNEILRGLKAKSAKKAISGF